ncbi:MAG TPA: ParB N-terminal domain-containing protein [Herpetosiphonaceae bacterium]
MARDKKPVDINKFFKSSALDFLAGATADELVERATAQGLPMLHLDPAAIAPDPEQLRHLTHPHMLLAEAEQGDSVATALVAELRALGASIREHGQIQPVIVYPDQDEANPTITHRLLHGQRRWSAAILESLSTLWAVEVPKPSRIDRALRQYEENERREGFTDMERAWALITLKEALEAESGERVPWEIVGQRMRLSEPRRKELLRLARRFSVDAQQIIQRYGWSEWMLRPIHQAIEDGLLPPEDATDMLRVLAESQEVNLAVVTALVTAYRRQQPSRDLGAPDEQRTEAPPSVLPYVGRHFDRIGRSLELVRTQLPTADEPTRQAVRERAEQLRAQIDTLLSEL